MVVFYNFLFERLVTESRLFLKAITTEAERILLEFCEIS